MEPYAIQGDVQFWKTTIPKQAKKKNGKIMVYGEATGHAHRFSDSDNVQLFMMDEKLYARVFSPATIIHEDHGDIPVEVGDYEIRRQREYTGNNMTKIVVD